MKTSSNSSPCSLIKIDIDKNKELAEALQSVEASISEIDSAMIDADVGILEPSDDSKTIATCLSNLAPLAKEIAQGIACITARNSNNYFFCAHKLYR